MFSNAAAKELGSPAILRSSITWYLECFIAVYPWEEAGRILTRRLLVAIALKVV